jgi:lipopolysaccharide export system protein LptA
MFTRIYVISTLIFIICSYVVYSYAIKLKKQDKIYAYNLETLSQHKRNVIALEKEPLTQIKKDVTKHIYLPNQDDPLKIQAEESTLSLKQKKRQIIAKETLKNVFIEDKKATFRSERAEAYYPSNEIFAQGSCSFVIDDVILQSEKVQIEFEKQIVLLDNIKGLQKTQQLEFFSNSATWDKKLGQIFLYDNVVIKHANDVEIHANKAVISLSKEKPDFLQISKEVEMIFIDTQNKKSYALADEMIYSPTTKTALLSRTPKVLLWTDGMKMSAQEMVFNHKTKCIEGKGTVCFHLNLEEENILQNLIEKYL